MSEPDLMAALKVSLDRAKEKHTKTREPLKEWPNGVPIISEEQRAIRHDSPEALRDLIATLWMYIGRYEEAQLTTEQKELLADVVESHERDFSLTLDRWWRGS